MYDSVFLTAVAVYNHPLERERHVAPLRLVPGFREPEVCDRG